MSVTLIAAVVALVLGHLAQSLAASVRHYGWYGDWLRWIGSRFPEGSFWHGRGGLILALLPPLLGVGLFQLALDEPLIGLGGLVFAIVVLFYAWGPRDLDLDEVEEYELVYPADADLERNRISVLAPIGTAILGYRVGDVIEWKVPAGLRRLRVEEVLYQPERAGVLRR